MMLNLNPKFSITALFSLGVFLLSSTNVYAGPDTSADLTKAFAFGEITTSDNKVKSTDAAPFSNNALGGPAPEIPRAMQDRSNKNANGSQSVIKSKINSRASQDPGAPAPGTASGEEDSDPDAEKANVSYLSTPGNPIDDLNSAQYNKEILGNFTTITDLGDAYYVVGGMDPLYKDVLFSSHQLGSSFSNNVYQARARMVDEYSRGGGLGQNRYDGLKSCEDEVAAQAGKEGDEAKRAYPAVACIASRLKNGLGSTEAAGGLKKKSAVLNSRSVNTRAGVLGGGGEIDQALQLCGFSSSTQLNDEARCESEAESVAGGGKVLAALRNSYRLYPDSDQSGGEDQATKRQEYKDYFGDQCHVCIQGGKSELGMELHENTIRLKVVKIPAGKNLAENFNELNKAVYDNLRKILYNKCYHDNYDASGDGALEKKGAEIFRLATGETTGDTETSYNDGNFWAGDAANGKNADNKLGGGISVKEALDYLSFEGFRLSPSIIDGIYDIVTEKNSVSELTSGVEGGGYSNNECDTRLGTELAWDKINPILSDSKSAAAANVKNEIRSIYNFARRITIGKIFDGCQQAMSKAQNVSLSPELGMEAVNAIARVCSGNIGDPTAFMRERSNNIIQINAFVDDLYKELAAGSGKSGSAVAKAFKGKSAGPVS